MCCQTISLRTACECLALSGLFWPVLAECDLKTTLTVEQVAQKLTRRGADHYGAWSRSRL
jgi:hypothetical protein